jgi:hypothetical protein
VATGPIDTPTIVYESVRHTGRNIDATSKCVTIFSIRGFRIKNSKIDKMMRRIKYNPKKDNIYRIGRII